MKNRSKLFQILTTALLATAFAASGLTTAGSALGLDATRPVWLAAALAAAACGVMSLSALGAVIGALTLALAGGSYAISHVAQLRSLPAFLTAWQSQQAAPGSMSDGGTALLVCLALFFSALYYLLLYRPGLSSLAVMLLGAMLVFSHGISRQASIAATVPGLVAAAAAFALSGGVQRDAPPLRVLLLPALAVAVALLLLPPDRMTWPPMERLADQVRNVFEQYFNFTHERIAFSISEEGYNHGGEINGQPVAMLGGPANPDQNPVMRVTADRPLLLRGTIRSTYTGYSWVDVTPKSRYLYYDLTHRTVRDRVFDLNHANDPGAFEAVNGRVELMDSATSTLFVPGRLRQFDMDLSNAVYYNSSGEMFMAREAQTGDAYGVVSLNPVAGDGLRQAVMAAEGESDGQYEAIRAAHSQLPDGVEQGLYALTGEITAGASTTYDRATAIADYLRRNMRYNLNVDYPPRGRDFASYFVLDTRQGYCSYFATAMAVMGRIAGLPTRYVEGYYARPGQDGTVTLTGMDAHAWAEIYFSGLGWIPFDATNGGPGAGDGGSGADGGATPPEYGDASGQSDSGESPFEDTSDAMDGETEDDASVPPEEDDTPDEPDQDDSQQDEPDDDDAATPPEDDSAPPDDAERPNAPWTALLPLLILLALALAAVWVWRRLRASDPMALCAATRRAQQGAMIAYRANLTLLAHMGQQPQSGETPDAFVARVCGELDNPDYAEFVHAVSHSRYGARPLKRENVDTGLRAYRRFLRLMRPVERLRFTLHRVMHGLGDFENIP